MSTINQRVITTFSARGGQAIATMSQIGAGFGNVGRAINENTRLSARLTNQWKALATTMRYAIAGQAVFGLTRMVGQLNQLQQQVGLISALGNMPAEKVVNGMSEIRTAAIESLTPLSDFNDGLINLYSSVEKPPPINAAANIMREISLTAQLAQTDVPNASKAITGMLNIFGEEVNLRNVQKYTRAIQDIVTSVPGGKEAGAQIMQQFPVIAAQLVAHRGTPAQGLAMFETLTRAGGSPSTWGRGLSFMLQTVGNLGSQTKSVREAWKSIGVTPEFVDQFGIQAAVNRGITAVRTRGIGTTRRTRGMTDDILDQLTQEMGTAALPGRQIGITGQGGELAGQLFGRVHALRAFTLLAANEPQFKRDIQTMQEDFDGTAKAIKRNREQVEKFTDPQVLRRAQIALQGLSQQAQLALEPVANVAAKIISGDDPRHPGGVTGFLNKHGDATKWGIRGAAGLAAAWGLGRFLGAGTIKKWGIGRLFGGGGLMGAGLAAQAIASGDTALGASPLHPMFVVIVDQLGGGMKMGKGSKTGLFGKVVNEAEDTVETGIGLKAAQKSGGWLKRLFGMGKGAKGAAALAKDPGFLARWGVRAGKFAGPIGVAATIGDFFYNADNVNKGENEWIARQEAQRRQTSHANLMKANQLWGKGNDQVTGVSHMGNFSGELWMTINLKHPDGTTEAKRVHVPVKMWANKYPSSGGKPKPRRSN